MPRAHHDRRRSSAATGSAASSTNTTSPHENRVCAPFTLRTIEVVCVDEAEHRRRVESRSSDLGGHTYPTWQEVQAVRDGEYEPWDEPRLTVDTAASSRAECLAQTLGYIAS